MHANTSPPAPSAPCIPAKIPGVSLAATTAAPAPSPNKIHVPLSFQSTIFDKVSTPIKSAFLYMPVFMYASAVLSANKNPEHAAFISNAVAFTAPNSF